MCASSSGSTVSVGHLFIVKHDQFWATYPPAYSSVPHRESCLWNPNCALALSADRQWQTWLPLLWSVVSQIINPECYNCINDWLGRCDKVNTGSSVYQPPDRKQTEDRKSVIKKPQIWLECGPFHLQKHYHYYQRSKSVTGRKINKIKGGGTSNR